MASTHTTWPGAAVAHEEPDAIYLQAGKGSMINLPTDGVDGLALQFIRARIAASQPKG